MHRARSSFFAAIVVGLCASALVVGSPRSARGDDQQELDMAAQLFRAATAAHARGDFRAAAQAFEEANRHSPRSGTLLNAALSWDAAGDPARAADDFARALAAGGLPDRQRDGARKRRDELARELGLVHVVGPPGAKVSIAHVQAAAVPVDVYVAAGSVALREIRPDGTAADRTITVGAGESRQITLEAPPLPPAAPAPTAPPIEVTGSAQRTWATVAIALAGVGAVTGSVLGLEALQARSAYESSAFTSRRAYDQAYGFRTAANVAFVASGAFAAAALVLWLTAPSRAPSDRHAAALGVGLGSATFDVVW